MYSVTHREMDRQRNVGKEVGGENQGKEYEKRRNSTSLQLLFLTFVFHKTYKKENEWTQGLSI